MRAPSVVARRELFERLSVRGDHGVTLVVAPAGSGKTVLLRSWIEDSGERDRVAWVTVEREERDPQHFWLSVIDALRAAIGADGGVERLEPSPAFDGEAVVERLKSELGSLEQPVLLVIDDLHELRSDAALRQLERLLAGRPPLVSIVISSRHDPRMGLHRLRLAGELTELRTEALRFNLDETRELLAGAGVVVSAQSLEQLHDRAEGWAAGLRLAALALAGHPDPDRFVVEFSGSERTVADYLFAEVLARQPDDARRLLLRTSILERVTGPLADVLTDRTGSRRILHELEAQNAFVVALDVSRDWFRYHRLFGELLRLELERSEPELVQPLHRVAAAWYEEHGHVVDAVRHYQASQDWASAGRVVARQSWSLALDGRRATVDTLLAGFPADAISGDPELALVFALRGVLGGPLGDAEAYIALADRAASSVPDGHRRRFQVSLALTRLMLARRRGDFTTALGEAQPLVAAEASPEELGPSNDVRARALLQLGIVELWSSRYDDAERHLELGLGLARLAQRPYLEVESLGHLAIAAGRGSLMQARTRALEALAIAAEHGWDGDGIAGVALVALATADVWQGSFEDADRWLERADAVVHQDLEPATALLLHVTRGRLHLARRQLEDAARAFRSAARLEALLVTPQFMTSPARRLLAQAQRQLGDTAGAHATLAELVAEVPEPDVAQTALAYAKLSDGDPRAAVDALAPVLTGSASGPMLRVEALLLDAAARDLLGESDAVQADVESALELAEPQRLIWPFLVTPAREQLERHPRHRTAHGALLSDILQAIAGSLPSEREPGQLEDELSDSELRVLRYLPSNLSAPEIARELYLSVYTVKTHMRHIYAKLGVHRRSEAVDRARDLGLLAPSSTRR